MIEREVKLRFPGAEIARAAVIAAGATPLHPRRLQHDVLLFSIHREQFGLTSTDMVFSRDALSERSESNG